MKCERARVELESLSRGELDRETAAEVRAHVEDCSRCRDDLAAFEELARALSQLPDEPVDARELANRVLERARREAPGRRGLLAVLGGLALVGGLAVVAAVLVATRSHEQPPSAPPSAASPPPPLPSAPTPPPPPSPAPVETPPVEEPPPPAPAPSPPPPPPEEIAVAPSPPPPPSPPAPVPLEGTVASAPGEARIRRSGAAATEWQPLAIGASVAPGDEVQAVSGAVELSLGRGKPAPEAAAVLGLERVVLAAGARATLAGESLRLEAGEIFASTSQRLTVVAATASVTVEGGDLGVALARRGVEVTGWAGKVSVASGGQSFELASQRISLDGQGKMSRPSPAGEAPRWLATQRALDVVLALRPASASLLVGERQGDAVRAASVARPRTRAVCFGRGDANGLAKHESGLRLRVRYRLDRSAPLGLQVTDPAHSRNFQAVVATPRAGAWTEIDFDLDRLVEERRTDKKLAPGDHLDLLTVSVHGEGATLEVSEITLFRPR